MKRILLSAAAAAILASAGCDARKSDGGATDAAVAIKSVKPPANGDWSTIVAAAAEGGYVMGNPNAKVKLVEYGSLTCPHCREFDETGVPTLIANYVKPGRVSWEFRNFVRDSLDLTASLIARCNGPSNFFALTRALYKDQLSWFARMQSAPAAQQQAAQNLGPEQQFTALAKLAGLQQWAAARGVPAAKSSACLADQTEVDRLVQMNSDATAQYDIPGTPSFVINGKLIEGATWSALEPQLRKAVGG
jgi:protein-disulfide isomerase